MALPTNLTNNEVKDRLAAAISFVRRGQGPGQAVEYAKSGEIPSRPHRLKVRHVESGSGINLTRRSNILIPLTFVGHVDSTKYATVIASLSIQIPVGNMTSMNEAKDVLANLGQFCFSLGAAETVARLDGSGYGVTALINGEI